MTPLSPDRAPLESNAGWQPARSAGAAIQQGAENYASRSVSAPIETVRASAYEFPTDTSESDGTLRWDSTRLVLVELGAQGVWGIGYSYTDFAAAGLISSKLFRLVQGSNALDNTRIWARLLHGSRNLGVSGVVASAIAALDMALWDLKAKLLGVSLVTLLGAARDEVPFYGSGGFTSYMDDQLEQELGSYLRLGATMVKMKVGREPDRDVERVRIARAVIGPDVRLFVDANGAYSRKQALSFAERFIDCGVSWFEEPVSSDDLAGLRLLRDRGPAGMDIAAGEYGHTLSYFKQMLDAGAVDVLQADATRCLGPTGFMKVAALCEANSLLLSAHTAPTLHTPLCCACAPAVHVEYFHDHARIEQRVFRYAPESRQGKLRPDVSRPGFGFELDRGALQRFAA